MKRLFLFLFALTALVACSKDDEMLEFDDPADKQNVQWTVAGTPYGVYASEEDRTNGKAIVVFSDEKDFRSYQERVIEQQLKNEDKAHQ